MSTLSPLALLAMKTLYELQNAQSAKALSLVLEVSLSEMESALAELLTLNIIGAVRTHEITQYTLLERHTVRSWDSLEAPSPCSLAACFRLRERGQELEAVAVLFERINYFLLHSTTQATNIFFALGIRYLTDYNEHNKDNDNNSRFIELALATADISMYLSRHYHEARELIMRVEAIAIEHEEGYVTALCNLIEACLENMAAECSAPRLRLLRIKCAKALRELENTEGMAQLHYFRGMFYFWEGNFQQVLTVFQEATQYQQIWHGRFQTEMFPLYTSSAAVYLGHFHQAVGILESARRTATLARNLFKTLWWEAQLAMVLLYMNRCDEALELINRVITQADKESETKIYLWGLRGLAYYHFRKGNIKAAHQQLTEMMHTAQRHGVRRPIYSYPWMFDMLYSFQQSGLPAIPGLILDTEIERSLNGPNAQLRAAAFRTRSERALDAGEKPEKIVPDLQLAVRLFEEVGNPLEAARTKLVIASCLKRQHKEEQAARLEKEALATLAFYEQPEGMGCVPRLAASSAAGRNKSAKRALSSPPETAIMSPQMENGSFSSNGEHAQASTLSKLQPDNPLKNCRLALESIPPWQDVQQFLRQMVYIASCELGAERAVLLERTDKGELENRATCNVSSAELSASAMASNLAGLSAANEKKPKLVHTEHGVTLLLPLCVEEQYSWMLYLESTYTVRTLKNISSSLLLEVAELFSQKLSMALTQRNSMPFSDKLEKAQAVPYQDSPETLYHGSASMRQIISRSRQVATTDAPVLILGETGVGKELLARYIHDCSGRKGSFVPVHPASIAENLFESEFFGHEKGAFTGAHKQKIGLVEMAHTGTLFIDEVADIPMPTQVKLLRVFQGKKFLRVGSILERHSEFRLVGATNKNLWNEVQAGRFREDLYYRMSVVPLTLPPLRERKEDIPILARLFLDRFARRYHRVLPPSVPEDMKTLLAYPWPGNVRELKSLIERAVILYREGPIQYGLPLPAESEPASSAKKEDVLSDTWADLPTLEELSQRYVKHVLDITRGRVTGEKGALSILGLKRSTFYAKYVSRHN